MNDQLNLNNPPTFEEAIDAVANGGANGWSTYRYHVLVTLRELKNTTTALINHQHKQDSEISSLKTKAAIWGGLLGFIASAATTLGIAIFMWIINQGN
jgi:hypothetical protein